MSTIFRTPTPTLVILGIFATPFIALAPVVLWTGLTDGDPGRLVVSLGWCGMVAFGVYDQGFRRAARIEFDGTTCRCRSALGRRLAAFRVDEIIELGVNGGFRWIAYGDGAKVQLGLGNTAELFSTIQSLQHDVPVNDAATGAVTSPTQSYRSNVGRVVPFVVFTGSFAAFGLWLTWAGATGDGPPVFVGLATTACMTWLFVGLVFFWAVRVTIEGSVCHCSTLTGRRLVEFRVDEITVLRDRRSWVCVGLDSGRTVRLFVFDRLKFLATVQRLKPDVHARD